MPANQAPIFSPTGPGTPGGGGPPARGGAAPAQAGGTRGAETEGAEVRRVGESNGLHCNSKVSQQLNFLSVAEGSIWHLLKAQLILFSCTVACGQTLRKRETTFREFRHPLFLLVCSQTSQPCFKGIRSGCVLRVMALGFSQCRHIQ